MQAANVVRFPIVTLPDSVLSKLIAGFRRSDCPISTALATQLSREAFRRARHGSTIVEVILPVAPIADVYGAKVGLMICGASMLEAVADGDSNALENPDDLQLAAEFCMEVVHALERIELFSAVTNTVN